MVDTTFGGKYQSQYDHAGLMLKYTDTVWLKCGVEFLDGRVVASVVVTNDYSDWSVCELATQEVKEMSV